MHLGHTPIIPSCRQEVHSLFILRNIQMARHCPRSCEGVVQDITQRRQSLAVTRPSHSCHAVVTRVRALSALAELIQHSCKHYWSGIHYAWRLPTLGIPSKCVILLQGGTDTQLPCNFLAMLGGTLQAQDQILDFLAFIMQHSHGNGKACKSSQGRRSYFICEAKAPVTCIPLT